MDCFMCTSYTDRQIGSTMLIYSYFIWKIPRLSLYGAALELSLFRARALSLFSFSVSLAVSVYEAFYLKFTGVQPLTGVFTGTRTGTCSVRQKGQDCWMCLIYSCDYSVTCRVDFYSSPRARPPILAKSQTALKHSFNRPDQDLACPVCHGVIDFVLLSRELTAQRPIVGSEGGGGEISSCCHCAIQGFREEGAVQVFCRQTTPACVCVQGQILCSV
jgi:hypothetical protein